MTVQELKAHIKQNTIPNFLIFTGEEWKVQQMYIEQIAKVKKLSTYYAYEIDEIWNKLNTKSFIDIDYLYILRDDKEFLTNEKIYSQIESKLKNNTLIYIATSVDKRLKCMKLYNSSIVEFNALKSDILKQYIQREIDLPNEHCDFLMEMCDYNYGHCLLEIDKIKCYVNSIKDKANTVTEARLQVPFAFITLVDDGTIHVPPRDTMWDFIRVFLQNKPKQAYELYEELKELETPTFAILSNLYNNTKQVLQVQTCTSDNIAKTTGLTSWQIRNAKECVGKIRAGDLAYLMRLIQKVESSIKQGKIDESIAIDYIFTDFYG